MTVRVDHVVPGGFGAPWDARAGEFITVIDLDGEQAGDFIAFVADDPEEWLSPVHCREALRSIFVRAGDELVTNRRRSVLAVVRDDVGIHDGTIPACDPTRYAVEFGVPGHRNCLENMWGSVLERGVSIDRMPEPLNLFQNTPVVGDGRVGPAEPARPTDRDASASRRLRGPVAVPAGHHPGERARPVTDAHRRQRYTIRGLTRCRC
jgi:uncharacterized protein YcgI (DUF1989 family)